MGPPRVIVVTKEVAPRELLIQKDVETCGHTKGCPGCRTMLQGGTRQAHTTECREGFRDLIKDEDEAEEEAGGDGMTIEAVLRTNKVSDDVMGGWLDRKKKVREARMEEEGYMKRKLLWDEVPWSDASGHRIVSVKWVDTNKGTEENPEIRCRLVARALRGGDKDKEDLFAAGPPWELKLLMSHAVDRSNGKSRKMLLIDVKEAHQNSDCTEDVFVELPGEVGAAQDKVGNLRRWLYGSRPAAAAGYAVKLEEVGFRRG